ncbi:MAG: dTMP kinase [Burkholderiales bacterium]|nr:dTMP kinase [Burkholderiales bacterium]
MAHGKFITLEGIDGAGKSTHLAWLTGFLRQRGIAVVTTREPGGTALGEKLRQLLLAEPMQPETETLLMFAARAEHLHTVIKPALLQGAWVVSDRFTDASFAYQSGGRGVAEEKLEFLQSWIQGSLQPDCTLLFDIPLEVSRQRLTRSGAALDRFEQEQADFFLRVRRNYLQRAAQSAGRIHIIDTTQPIGEVQERLERILLEHCLA